MKRLVRSANRKIAGVCAGVAEFFGWDVATVRLVWFLLAILGVGAPVLFYLILSIVMPAENQAASFEERMNKRLGK
ncbi:MAG: PspC domain-containing protein [Bacteroidaceae bacterium]|nr:PspC domain-containing protein [Bacteroidaceae bacterium]